MNQTHTKERPREPPQEQAGSEIRRTGKGSVSR